MSHETPLDQINAPFTIPLVCKSEPGWRVAMVHEGKIVLVPIVAWRLAPRTINDGFAFSTTHVLGCEPMVAKTVEMRSLNLVYGPDVGDAEVQQRLDKCRGIYEKNG